MYDARDKGLLKKSQIKTNFSPQKRISHPTKQLYDLMPVLNKEPLKSPTPAGPVLFSTTDDFNTSRDAGVTTDDIGDNISSMRASVQTPPMVS